MPSAREVALKVLLDAGRDRSFVADELDERLERVDLEVEDRALATTLVYGVVRHRATLDHLVAALARDGLAGTDPRLLEVLRIGAYQLLFLDQVPAYAVVNEAVKAARRFGGRRAGSFVNGVLRQLDRWIVAKGSADGEPAERTVPVPGGRFTRLKEDLLPGEGDDVAHSLAVRYSYPVWLARHWLAAHGLEVTRRLCAAGNERPEICVRANRLRGTRERLRETLEREGAGARPGAEPDALYVLRPGRLPRLESFRRGLFSVQDEAAQVVAPFVGARPGDRILDLCAAPGGKSAHLAELMGDRGLVVACDRGAARVATVRRNCRRLGIAAVSPLCADGRALPLRAGERFDGVLVDAPCSNTGVLARRVEARWRVTERELARLAALQAALLAAAAARVRPGGALVYSTCAIEEAEDAGQIRRFLAAHADFVLEAERLLLPEPPRSGGYVARLRRHGETP